MRLTLTLIGNHNIDFNRPKDDITSEIEDRLNGFDLLNKDYHLEKARSHLPRDPTFHKPLSHDRKWHYRTAFINSWGMLIQDREDDHPWYTFTGPYGLQLDIERSRVCADLDYISYDEWFCPDIGKELLIERTIWRVLFYQILKALGGEKMVYIGMYLDENYVPLTKEDVQKALEYEDLSEIDDDGEYEDDNYIEEFFLTKYLASENFTDLIMNLSSELGSSAKTFEETGQNLYSAYFIDNFKDIRLEP